MLPIVINKTNRAQYICPAKIIPKNATNNKKDQIVLQMKLKKNIIMNNKNKNISNK